MKKLMIPKFILLMMASMYLKPIVFELNSGRMDEGFLNIFFYMVLSLIFFERFRRYAKNLIYIGLFAYPYHLIFDKIRHFMNYEMGLISKIIVFFSILTLSITTGNFIVAYTGYLLKGFWKKLFKKNYVLEKVEAIKDAHKRGYAFEELVKETFKKLGYEAYTTTDLRKMKKLPECIQKRGGSGEQGVDVILFIDGKKTIIQCKCYSQKVDNKAVQEIVGAKALYEADEVGVITNNYFTGPAQELAEANNVLLMDRDKLKNLIKEANFFAR